MIRLAGIAVLAMLTASCAGGGPRPLPQEQFERAIAGAPGEAQPSRIVATELAFARMAQEQGQWTAFRAFAAPGAVIHARSGPVDAQQWLAGLDDPAEAVRWNPRVVWMNCDGKLAVSQGRFRDPGGIVGFFVTVWEQQAGGEYRWTYNVAVKDDPQPPTPPPSAPVGENDIVVSALDAIQGIVADCPKRGEAVPAPPAFTLPGTRRHAATIAGDGTLRWRWEHEAGADRRIVVDYLTAGQWNTGLDQSLGSATPAAEPQ